MYLSTDVPVSREKGLDGLGREAEDGRTELLWLREKWMRNASGIFSKDLGI